MSSNNSNNNYDNSDDRYTITARDLLQANAAMVAGVLIFLAITISSNRPFTLLNTIIVRAGIFPFIFSFVFLLQDTKSKEHRFKMAKRIVQYGLFGLIAAIVLFLSLSQYLT